jgi:hypothetical protein
MLLSEFFLTEYSISGRIRLNFPTTLAGDLLKNLAQKCWKYPKKISAVHTALHIMLGGGAILRYDSG